MQEPHELRQEPEAIGRAWTAIVLATLLPFVVLLGFGAAGFLRFLTRDRGGAATVSVRPTPVASVGTLHGSLFAHPADGERLAAEQRARLGRYAWVDRDAGVVRVPIDVALTLVVDAGAKP